MADWASLALSCLREEAQDEEVEEVPQTSGPSESSGWASAALAAVGEIAQPEAQPFDEHEESISFLVSPVGGAKAVARRGRRSTLLVEAQALVLPKAAQKAPVDRRAILARAQAAKAEKRRLAQAGGDEVEEETCSALVIRPPSTQDMLQAAMFSERTMEEIRRGRFSGAFETSPLVSVAGDLSRSGSRNSGVGALLTEYARTPEATVSSLGVQALKLGVSQCKLPLELMRAGCAVLLVDHALHRQLECALAAANIRLVMYVDNHDYDETPMQTRMPEVEYDIVGAPEQQQDLGQGLVRFGGVVEKVALGEDTGPSKLFQCLSTVAMCRTQRTLMAGDTW